MRRLIKYFILLIVIACIIISLNKKYNNKINYKYAFLVSSAFKPNYKSKIVLVDKRNETKKEVILDKNLYNILYVDDEGKIYVFATDKAYRYEYDYKKDTLNKIENPKTNNNNLCQGRVDSIIETNKGPAFIINVGLKEEDSYYHYVLVDNECYELGVYYNQGAYDFNNNLLYIDGYQMFNDTTNFKSYAIDLETYDYDLNLISSDFIDDNITNILVHRILVLNNKLYYYTPVSKNGNICEYDIINKKIIDKFNPGIKFNEGQLVISIGINKNNQLKNCIFKFFTI